MNRLGIDEQFDEVWKRKRSKSDLRNLMDREKTPIKNFVSANILRKFLKCYRFQMLKKRNIRSFRASFTGALPMKEEIAASEDPRKFRHRASY